MSYPEAILVIRLNMVRQNILGVCVCVGGGIEHIHINVIAVFVIMNVFYYCPRNQYHLWFSGGHAGREELLHTVAGCCGLHVAFSEIHVLKVWCCWEWWNL